MLTGQAGPAAFQAWSGFVGFIDPGALAVPIDTGGGEVAHPVEGELAQQGRQGIQGWVLALAIGRDRAEQVGGAGQVASAGHEPGIGIKGQPAPGIGGARIPVAPMADGHVEAGLGHGGCEATAAETAPEY